MGIKAVLFDLHGTLTRVEKPVTDDEASEFLMSRCFEVSPQQFKAAWAFVAFIDYPKYGYAGWRTFLRRVLMRLKIEVDDETLRGFVELYRRSEYSLYPDVAVAVARAKNYGLQTAIVTTIAHFKFKEAIKPIKHLIDFVCTGYEARCDKSNPKMYKVILQTLGVKPEETVVIGDDIQYDVLLPKEMGMHSILLDREMRSQGVTGPDAVARDLTEAVKIVGEFTRS